MGKPARQRERPEAIRPAETRPVAASGKRHGWRLLAIWGLLFIAYSDSFQAGLLLDNAAIIGQDPRIRHATAQNVLSILEGGYRYNNPDVGLYRPLTTLTYMVNYAVFGNQSRPAGYHSANLALHCINVSLVYALGIAVFVDAAPAFALAALWGLHPVLTESVTNIVGRADLLAALGVLAGLLCFARAVAAAGRERLAWLAGLAGAQAIGIFSKESAVILPGLMLLYDITWIRGIPWRSRVPAYAVLALPLSAFFYLRDQLHTQMLIPFADNPLVNAGFWTARLTAIKVIGKFLGLFLWPTRLSPDYSFNAVPLFGGQASRLEDAGALIALAVCLAAAAVIAVLAMRARPAEKPILFFAAFFFIALLPTSNLIVIIGSIMAERFLYLPCVALAGLAAAAICGLAKRSSLRPRALPVAWTAVALLCLAFAARTYARNLDWKDDLSLWSSAVKAVPESAKAHYNLGEALEAIPGRMPEAVSQYRDSLRIDPNQADAHNNLANALLATPGRVQEAIAEYQAAMRLQPGRAEPHNNLANALANMPGRLPEAIAEYRAALRIEPENAEIHYMNNGHPSSLAGWIDILELSQGSHVFHVGCGTGYYTAIMAEVVTSAGRVFAVEIDAGLARRAAANLAHLEQVVVACADGISCDPGDVDAILVNAGVTHLQSSWLRRLNNGGRLLVPITLADRPPGTGSGQMLLVHRLENKYKAAFVSPVGIYSSPSGRDPDCASVLAKLFHGVLKGKRSVIQSVRVDFHVVDESCLLHTEGACLSTLP